MKIPIRTFAERMIAATGLCLLTSAALAVPILNENAAYSISMTVYADHADPNVFYVAPNVMTVCLDENQRPRFAYQEIRSNGVTHAIVQMTLCTRYTQQEVQSTFDAIRAKNPNARFTALPYSSSMITFSPVLSPFVVQEFCSSTAGLVGHEQTCSFRLNSQGRRNFLANVRERVAMTHELSYSVLGFTRQANGSVSDAEFKQTIAIRIGGEELAKHPDLFRDTNGNPIPMPKKKD